MDGATRHSAQAMPERPGHLGAVEPVNRPATPAGAGDGAGQDGVDGTDGLAVQGDHKHQEITLRA